MIHTGDAIEVMRTLPEASVDAVCTDPPYALAFMSKHWDAHPSPRSFMEWCTEWGREALRVTVPGGYLLAFGGTRTHHRLVCGLEDAGWIIRDELDWIFAQGFPKGKANLKPAHEPIVLARKSGPLRPLAIDACRIETNDKLGGGAEVRVAVEGKHEGWRRPWMDDPEAVDAHTARVRENVARAESLGRWPSNILLSDPELFDVANPEVVGSGADLGISSGSSAPRIHEAGWGMKATGLPTGYGDSGGYSRFFRIPTHEVPCADCNGTGAGSLGQPCSSCSGDGLDRSGEYPRHFIIPKADRADREPVLRGQLEAGPPVHGAGSGDSNTLQVSDSKTQRENAHPTVKPVDLMRHLVRLVTPSGGTVLDPFAGSGSTILACELEGFAWIAIEKEIEYVRIMEARLNGTQRGMGLVS